MVTTYQYPQFLYALNNATNSAQASNGSWEDTAKAWTLRAICREESNGKGTTIQAADGTALLFASLIQLPKGTARIDEGTEVIVTRQEVEVEELLSEDYIATAKASGLIVARGTCQKFDFGRFHSRIWI